MKRFSRLVVLAGLALGAAGCDGDTPLVVASKNFSEQVLLGEIVARHLESTGIPVRRRFNLGGTLLADRALRSGAVDLYVEYTGTALTTVLKEPVAADPDAVFALVRDAYARDGLVWLEPLGFENTFAILVRRSDARRLGLTRISDLAGLDDWRPGFGYEFKDRQDGLPGLLERYRLRFDPSPVFMEIGLLYRALAQGQIDVTAGNSTDGLIEALDLEQLEDDRDYFPPYQASIVVRREALERVPGLEELLGQLSGTIDDERMRHLNLEVDGKNRPVSEVAAEFLEGLEGSTG